MKTVVESIPASDLSLVENVSSSKVYIFHNRDTGSIKQDNYGIIFATSYEAETYRDIAFDQFTKYNHWTDGIGVKRTLKQLIQLKLKQDFTVLEFDNMLEVFKFMSKLKP